MAEEKSSDKKVSYIRDYGPEVNKNGYDLIPLDPRDKKPLGTYKNWPNNPLSATQFPHFDAECGIGAICGFGDSRLCVLDCDLPNERAAKAVRSVLIEKFPKLRLGLFRVGAAPKFAIICRASEAGWSKAMTAYYSSTGENFRKDASCGRLEVLNKGQQVVLYHTHPGTKQPYRYETPEGLVDDNVRTPRNTPVTDLPVLTREEVHAIQNAVIDSLEGIGFKPVSGAEQGRLLTSEDDRLEDDLMPHRPVGLTIGQIREYFTPVPEDWATYGPWVSAGMRIHHETSGSEEGLALWIELSSQALNYKGPDDCRKHWKSFRRFSGHALTMWPLAKANGNISALASDLNDSGLYYRAVIRLRDRCAFFKDTGESALFSYETRRWNVFTADEEISEFVFKDLILKTLNDEADEEENPNRKAAIMRFQESCKKSPSYVQDRVLKLLKRTTELIFKREEFDSNPKYFACRNGVLNLDTAELEVNEPSKRCILFADVDYDPKLDCPKWKESMRLWFLQNPALIPYMQKIFGMAMRGKIFEQQGYFCVGTGANGKSVCLNTIFRIFSKFAAPLEESTIMVGGSASKGGPRTDLKNLVSKRFVYLSETSERSRLDAKEFKSLTVPDPRSYRALFSNTIGELHPAFVMFIGTNYPPLVDDESHATWRRIRLIHFKSDFDNDPELRKLRDRRLEDKLFAERSGILNWMLRGLRDYEREGLQEPQEVISDVNEYREEQDLIGLWASTYLKPSEKGRLMPAALYASFRAFMNRSGESYVLPQKSFTARLKRRFGDHFKRMKKGNTLLGFELATPEDLAVKDEDFEELDSFSFSPELNALF